MPASLPRRHVGLAEHRRHRRAVDVGVEQADRRAVLPQRQREVGRDRRLADAALARGDRDDVLHARQPIAARLAELLRAPRRVDVELDLAGAGRLGAASRTAFSSSSRVRMRRRRQLQLDARLVAVAEQLLDVAERDDVLAEQRVLTFASAARQLLDVECHRVLSAQSSGGRAWRFFTSR